MNRPQSLWIAGVILSSLALGCSNSSVSTESSEPKKPLFVGGKEEPRDTVTPISVKPQAIALNECGFGGVEQAINAAKGKVVLVDCWATWCPPCVASFPKLVEKHEKYANKGLAVISVSMDRPTEGAKVIAFLQKHNATFTNLLLKMDEAAQVGLQEKFDYMNAIPHAVLFNKNGQRVWSGHPLNPELQSHLEAELGR
ncbi:MAG: TlpA family protein disulfide reductase [Planctomycetes bacterium]|nr:TlpA family protein disulfide reductase [Planctomycetota bacterium]